MDLSDGIPSLWPGGATSCHRVVMSHSGIHHTKGSGIREYPSNGIANKALRRTWSPKGLVISNTVSFVQALLEELAFGFFLILSFLKRGGTIPWG